MSSQDAALQNCLPFIIGVTGHRDIYHSDDLSLKHQYQAQIKQALEYWRSVIGDSTPIWLMTGMAAGSDLLAAEVALEIQKASSANTIKVIGCLPMPLDHFKQDFNGLEYLPQAYEQLEHTVKMLNENNNELMVVRHNLSDDDYKEACNDLSYGELRNSLYLNQGLFIAKYSNVLLSLWDGKSAQGVGGTTDVVMYKLGADIVWPTSTENPALQPISDFDGQTSGLVHHIPVTRLNSKSDACAIDESSFTEHKAQKPLSAGKLYSSLNKHAGEDEYLQGFLSQEFEALITELGQFNKAAKTHDTAMEASSKANSETKSQPENGLCQSRSIFQTADELALAAQTKYRRFVLLFFLIAIPGYALYEVAGNWLNSGLGLGIFALILAVILGCWKVIDHTAKQDIKWNYQLARGVAEAMRIRGFLNMANVEPSAATLIPRRFRLHLPLLNHAISIAEIDWWRNQFEYNHQEIKSKWLADQLGFLKSRLNQNASSLKELIYKRPSYAANLANRYARNFFYGSIACGALLLFFMIIQQAQQITVFNSANEILMFMVQYGLMIAGLIVLWSELAGYEMTAKGYESLEELYRRALSLLSGELTPSKKQMLLDLAREAMFEHVTWTSSEINNDLKQKQ